METYHNQINNINMGNWIISTFFFGRIVGVVDVEENYANKPNHQKSIID